jgi:hypothetical protein
MYGNPVLFPQVTNREDLLRTVSLFDDLTGQPIDISGRTLQFPGDFTSSSWKVVDNGAINTTSASTITVKDYPFGNQMQAIPLTVGLNLGILPGDPVTISDALTGLNTLTGYVTSYAPATGAMVVQIGAAFDFEMRAHRDHNGDGYGPSWGVGSDGGVGPIIRAQLGSGITVIGTGVIQILIPAAQMFQLHRARTYNVALGMYLGPDTRQIFLGKQPVLYGGLSTQPIAPVQPANPYGLP